jgi:hypothetical protein
MPGRLWPQTVSKVVVDAIRANFELPSWMRLRVLDDGSIWIYLPDLG